MKLEQVNTPRIVFVDHQPLRPPFIELTIYNKGYAYIQAVVKSFLSHGETYDMVSSEP